MNATTEPNDQSREDLTYERLLETVKALDSQKSAMDEDLKQTFADCIEPYDKKSADKIRKDGLPEEILVGSELYENVSNTIGRYVKVTKFAVDFEENRNQVWLSWFKYPKWVGLNGL